MGKCASCGALKPLPGNCQACGAEPQEWLAEPARGVSEPPTAWRAMSWVLLGGALIFLLFNGYRFFVVEGVLNTLNIWSGDRAGALEVLDAVQSANALMVFSLLLFLAVIIGARVWMSLMTRTAAALGDDPAALKKHWTYLTWRISTTVASLALLVMAFTTTPTASVASLAEVRETLISVENRQLLIILVNVGYAVLAGATVVALYRRLHRLAPAAS